MMHSAGQASRVGRSCRMPPLGSPQRELGAPVAHPPHPVLAPALLLLLLVQDPWECGAVPGMHSGGRTRQRACLLRQ
eukprot:scaffold11587_cov22-Tisochrysis_lutea.AAC.1